MTRKFDFSLSARSLFPLFIAFHIPFLALYGVSIFLSSRSALAGARGLELGLAYVCLFGMLLLGWFFAVPFLRRIVPAVSLEGKRLDFTGKLWPFVGINLLGFFLSVITLGVYAPWYITRVSRWLAAHTSYDGRPWEFTGKGGRLFVILLLSLVLPLIVLVAVIAIIAVTAASRGGPFSESSPQMLVTQLITFAVTLLIIPAYTYEMYRWYFASLRVGDVSVEWKTRFWPSVGMILLQIFLSLVTLSVYFPAAYVRLYRYFAARTRLQRGGSAEAVGFEGGIGKGFGLIWGQTLLCLVTAGIYAPWAGVRIARWIAVHTTVTPLTETAPAQR
jgi:uncharacterized membrane protein YjgN (DUF898 family)